MYKSFSTKKFKKSLEKIRKSGQYNMLDIEKVVDILILGEKLDAKYQDHSLTGKLSIYRECHIKSDLFF
ncbi:type II toxin-antitoxin system YafQ family toxin [Patescibacteria group bacterium]|nr:type II toxin-antitoxin system YafQ family toxin [Patescibacteria group bacterium]